MKKIMSFVLVMLLLAVITSAQTGSNQVPVQNQQPMTAQGITDMIAENLSEDLELEDLEELIPESEEEMIAAQQMAQNRMRQLAQNPEQLKQQIQEKRQEMIKQQEEFGKAVRNIYQNQNQVRLAVHSLLAMENLTGGIGRNISAIAKEFNNSVQETINAEEKIQSKSRFARLFSGGDKETGEELKAEAEKNQERIRELKQLREECECEEEVRAMMQEQIQNMELEQQRLSELAEKEIKSKGLFGWIWK